MSESELRKIIRDPNTTDKEQRLAAGLLLAKVVGRTAERIGERLKEDMPRPGAAAKRYRARARRITSNWVDW